MVAVNDVPAPTPRPRQGRWLGGVCAGLAARWGVPVRRVRLGFVVASAVLGLGVLVYLAAWLILPGEGANGGQRGIVLLAQAIGALLGLATLAAVGAAATVFGYGWAVVAGPRRPPRGGAGRPGRGRAGGGAAPGRGPRP